MVSSQVKLAHNIVGIIGNVVSFALFLSPIQTMWRIYKKKSVEEFQVYPYITTVMNCLFWVFYGLPLVTKDSILVTTINGIGLVIEIIYLAIFFYYDKENRVRKKIIFGLIGEIIFIAIIIVTAMLAFPFRKRNFFVGIFCDIFNIAMYASPLMVANKVRKTKSVKYMPFYLSFTGFVNACIWTAYGLILFDPFVLASNGTGVFCGAVQLIIYAIYYRYTPKDDDTVKPSEVQLSGRTPMA